MEPRKLVAEALGTALLVFVGVGVATLSFGFKFAGASTSAGVVATAHGLRPCACWRSPTPRGRSPART